MNLSYVKSPEDQALLDEAYNKFVWSLQKPLQNFVKDLVWNKLQKETNTDELSYTAKKAKELIEGIDFEKVNKSLYISRTSNIDQVSALVQNRIVSPIFDSLDIYLNDTYADQFELERVDSNAVINWDNLWRVMNDLYKKSIEQDRIETENLIAENKRVFDSIFEMSGDE